MSVNSTLELALRDILHVINPLPEDWSTRYEIINELQAVVQSVESLRGATVEPFGSFVSVLFTRWGDLDLSIELPNNSYIPCAGKRRKLTLLGEVLKALRRKGGWRKLQFVPNARVPILKLESYQNISCDISINNLNGQIKSKLLYWINLIDGRFRDMVLLVKEWAKAHNINDPKFGTLNSYSLSLLVIFHFQTCVPAILPPLREIYPGNLVDGLTGVRADAERHIEETCAANIFRFKEDRSRIVNRSSLSELFISFLSQFSSMRASEHGICTYTGQWEDIDSNMRWMPKTFALFIEDPFEQPLNTARSVSSGQMTRISEAFQTTHRMLTSANQNHGSLIATLVRPRILSSVFTRTPSINPNDYNRTRPQVQRNVHSPSQVQQQFQSMRLDSRPTNTTTRTQRPAQTFYNQGQQSWRPRSNR
ncbi:protein HESO1 [Cornus florida]|uniref:protein HESO1 n=1 Tax=Cornus florida TaxID=4283 RepID=UPI0028A0C122|nr:protein HESO1 [Cornus florida]XP_059628092.1 protein HESO1 [Cornus florida]XP_059628093.1 protein HESO1 [Cornus florida]XP_059628094.1 protein HESO1 [Cornus florida]XP_059628095.1 protein HESO1 [Cornus florida]XP_059628096.1 protein HESO1 [Cornus florida]